MRILFIAACPLPWPRGTPVRVHRMAEALSAHGHDVQVVTYPRGDESVETPYRLHRVGSPDTKMDPSPGPSLKKLLWLDPQLWRKVRSLLATQSFDVIHAHHYEGLIVALTARRFRGSLPIIFDAHTLLATELPHYSPRLPRRVVSRFGASLDRYLPRQADHVVAVSERMRRWFQESGAIPAPHLSLIPNGVEHWLFVENPDTAVSIRAVRDSPRIVFAGNLAEYQGIEALLEAFSLVRDRIAEARLVLVTESRLDDLENRIRELGIDACVDLVTSRFDDLPSHLASGDVLVNPRIECDGIPQKLLNYMAAGKPVVSFEGSASLLVHERTGLVVPDADVAGFADAIVRLLLSPQFARKLGTAARREVVESYGWEGVANQVESAYQIAMERMKH